MNQNNYNIDALIIAEVERISKQVGKAFLDCEDIIKLTGLGRDNVRTMMRSKSFPIIKIGKRQVVSIVNFVIWQFSQHNKGDTDYGN